MPVRAARKVSTDLPVRAARKVSLDRTDQPVRAARTVSTRYHTLIGAAQVLRWAEVAADM